MTNGLWSLPGPLEASDSLGVSASPRLGLRAGHSPRVRGTVGIAPRPGGMSPWLLGSGSGGSGTESGSSSMSPRAWTWGVPKAAITSAWALPASSPTSLHGSKALSPLAWLPLDTWSTCCVATSWPRTCCYQLCLCSLLRPLGRWVGLAWAQRAGAEGDGDGPAGKDKGARRQTQR